MQMAILSRIYPCRECADHFKDVLSANPVQAGSQAEFSQWLCHVHNVVNRIARWGKLDCKERACDLEGASLSTEYRRPSWIQADIIKIDWSYRLLCGFSPASLELFKARVTLVLF
ncbi:thiol oxidase [Ranunculus cassubicifolius]